jgi:gluconate 2-dehydrogenase gamma chain
MKRRLFLGIGFLTIAILLFRDKKVIGAVSPIETIKVLQSDLFSDFTPTNYLENVILKHTKVQQSEKNFIRNGAGWLNEEAIKLYKLPYTKLSKAKRQIVLKTISKTTWGDNWLYTMMGYMFESMLGDPIYGINENGSGWSWLEFEAGLPQPKKAYL